MAEEFCEFVGHGADGVCPVFSVLLVKELVEGVDVCAALIVLALDDAGDAAGQPGRQLPDFHVIVEVDVADVLEALEGELAVAGVGGEGGVGLHHVQGME